MQLVIDVNVIFSAVLNRGDSLNTFIQNFQENKFELIAPLFLILELGKHTERIAKKTKFSFEDAVEILEFIISQITFIQDNEWSPNIEDARKLLGDHEKDVPYLALALKYNCDIFSGDKMFKQLCPDRVRNPREILEDLSRE